MELGASGSTPCPLASVWSPPILCKDNSSLACGAITLNAFGFYPVVTEGIVKSMISGGEFEDIVFLEHNAEPPMQASRPRRRFSKIP